jgi:glycosyltransferase involved in cell wall biosynthesis
MRDRGVPLLYEALRALSPRGLHDPCGHRGVEFAGHCEDVQAELSKADLFVLPSYAEGNSNAILEAMRACLPVIATRVGGLPIQVGSNAQHFLVKPGDREALADRLLKLIEDDVLRRNVGALMHARITELFSIERVAATYEKAYELILAGRRQDIGQLNQALFSQTRAERDSGAD